MASMIATLQRWIVASLLLAALGWAGLCVHQGELLWAIAGVTLLLTGHAVFLGLEFVLLAVTQPRGSPLRATPAQLLSAWWGEVLAAPRVFAWRQPWRTWAEPDHLPATGQTPRRGVVFVHGFFCNRAFWNPWMAQLRPLGVPHTAVTLEPAFGSIDAYATIIDAAVRRVTETSGLPPVLVAHSMGGLASRVWLAAGAAPDRIHRLITIGSPHHGTWLARFGHTTNGKQMRLGGEWLRALAEREPAAARARTTCLYSHCDNIVFPIETAVLDGAENRHLAGKAHVQLAFEPECLAELLFWLGQPVQSGQRAPVVDPHAIPGTQTSHAAARSGGRDAKGPAA